MGQHHRCVVFFWLFRLLTFAAGYINIDEAQAGSPNEEYWGCIDEGDLILDKDGNKIGELDPGKAWVCVINITKWLDFSIAPYKQVKDVYENTIAELDNSGECKGHDSSFIGQFQGFTYRYTHHVPFESNLTPRLQGHENRGAISDHYRSQHVCYLGRCLILSLYLHSFVVSKRTRQ